MGPANDKPPSILNGVGIAQHLNQQLPLNLTFTDDAGKQVHLGELLRQAAGDSGAGLLPLPDALLRRDWMGLTSALQMVQLRSGQGLQHDRGQHRSRPREPTWRRRRSAST